MLALNGDELLDVDFGALLAEHERSGAAATIVVAQVRSPFGIVALEDDGRVSGFREAPLLDNWVNTGVYVLGPEALDRLPEKGDHEQSTFPELAAEGKLRGYRHDGVWLTVNTPKDLRRAAEFMEEHPDWRPLAPNRRMTHRLAELRGARPLGVRAAPRREAVGLGADLGRGGGLRREDPLRPRRPVAQPAVPQREGRELVRAGGQGRRSSSATSGQGVLNTRGDRPRRLLPLPRRARCTASPRSRTRRSSRSRRRTSTTSCGSRIATAGHGHPSEP